MSTDRDMCPYFVGLGKQTIRCAGVEPQVDTEVSFGNYKNFEEHYNALCAQYYCNCMMVKCLDNAFSTCPHNSGVACSEKGACSKCGWNPDVSKKRLASFFEDAEQTLDAMG